MKGIRKVDCGPPATSWRRWHFPIEPVDPFFNANRPEDFEAAAALLDLSGTP